MSSFGKISGSKCPGCGRMADAYTNINGQKDGPVTGDLALCFYCGQVNAYDENLNLVLPAEDWKSHLDAAALERIDKMQQYVKNKDSVTAYPLHEALEEIKGDTAFKYNRDGFLAPVVFTTSSLTKIPSRKGWPTPEESGNDERIAVAMVAATLERVIKEKTISEFMLITECFMATVDEIPKDGRVRGLPNAQKKLLLFYSSAEYETMWAGNIDGGNVEWEEFPTNNNGNPLFQSSNFNNLWKVASAANN